MSLLVLLTDFQWGYVAGGAATMIALTLQRRYWP